MITPETTIPEGHHYHQHQYQHRHQHHNQHISSSHHITSRNHHNHPNLMRRFACQDPPSTR